MIKLVEFKELPNFALVPRDLAEGEELGHRQVVLIRQGQLVSSAV
jgi:hypothetical protein